MQARDDKSIGLFPAALLAMVVALVGLAGAVKIAQTADALGPSVGDIVQFDPHTTLPRDMETRLAVARSGAADCTLDLDVIHRSGGSLIVEQRNSEVGPARYRVHWSGQHSAGGPADCGREADLMLDDANLDQLAMAAGGWGVGNKHVVPSAVWIGSGSATRTQ